MTTCRLPLSLLRPNYNGRFLCQEEIQNLVGLVHVLQNTQNFLISRIVVFQLEAKKRVKIYNMKLPVTSAATAMSFLFY